jgi:hypothetical protein
MPLSPHPPPRASPGMAIRPSPSAASVQSRAASRAGELSEIIVEEQRKLTDELQLVNLRSRNVEYQPPPHEVAHVVLSVLNSTCVGLWALLFSAQLDLGSDAVSSTAVWIPVLVFDVAAAGGVLYFGFDYLRTAFRRIHANNAVCLVRGFWYIVRSVSCLVQMALSPSGVFIAQSALLAARSLGGLSASTSWWVVLLPSVVLGALLVSAFVLSDLVFLWALLAMSVSSAFKRLVVRWVRDLIGDYSKYHLLIVTGLLLNLLVLPFFAALFLLILRLEGARFASAREIAAPLFVSQLAFILSICWMLRLRRYAWLRFYHVWRGR